MSLETAQPSAWSRFAPIGAWAPRYDRAWAASDVLAGLAIWAVMVPESMAYAGIVGVPAIMGLYTIVPPLIAYAVFGTSRVLVVGPDTATGVISALTVGALAARGSGEFVALTTTLAVMIGGLFLLFGTLRMGWVAAFISTPVMRGFIEGLILVTIVGQIPALLGLHGASGSVFAKLAFLAQHIADIPAPAAICGGASLVAMLLLRRFAPRLPAALIVAAAGTGAMTLFGGSARGIDVVGFLPTGLPEITLPQLDAQTLLTLVPGALSIVLVGYAEALGAAKAAIRPGEELDPNQELTAHGFANVASGLFGGFLAVGSLSKTSVAIAAGARTQAANLVAAALTLLTLLVLTPLFRNLPHPALAAIVIAAMLHLSKPSYLAKLAADARWELALALGVIAGELVLGVLQGIALGVVASLLLLIYRTSHLGSAVLGKLPGEQAYRDVLQHPEALTFPGLLIFNPGGPLFFASIGQFEHNLWTALGEQRPATKRILIDASSITFVDVSAREALLGLIAKLKTAGIGLAFARVRDPVRAKLQAAGVVDAVGPAAFYDRLTDGVEAFERDERKAPQARSKTAPRTARG
jgi:high affinity sulfate transporter 1